jgi:hypothetical protein
MVAPLAAVVGAVTLWLAKHQRWIAAEDYYNRIGDQSNDILTLPPAQATCTRGLCSATA